MMIILGLFSMQIGITLCTRAKRRLTDWDFIEKEKNTCLAFAKVFATCEHHEIKHVIELKYDWNDEMIL
jgi:hypothetical protein